MNDVKDVINNWDPINLLSHAPEDEYHLEIYKIERLCNTTNDFHELARGINNIFLEAFGEDSFKKIHSECLLIAQKILSLE